MNKQSGFHIWVIIVIIAALGIIGLVVWAFLNQTGIINRFTAGDNFAASLACKDRDVKFTSPPMRMEDLGYIRPLGAMLDGHVTPADHVYVGPVDANVEDNTYPVLMPADGTVVEVSRMPAEYVGDREFDVSKLEDHRIVMSFNCRYASIYIHIHKLSDALAAAAPDLKPSENKSTSVELKAGDVVGYIGGSTFDWTPIDGEKVLTGFIHPDLYKGESWKINTVSPFDLYEGSLKAELEAKSWRSKAPIGGQIDYDQPGKLIGNWFREGSGGYSSNTKGGRYWDGHLSVVPDYIDPAYSIVSIGNWSDASKQFLVDEMVDLASINAESGFVKFQLQGFRYSNGDNSWSGNSFATGAHPEAEGNVVGTIGFQVLPGEKLKVEKFIGKTKNQVTGFTSAVQTYER